MTNRTSVAGALIDSFTTLIKKQKKKNSFSTQNTSTTTGTGAKYPLHQIILTSLNVGYFLLDLALICVTVEFVAVSSSFLFCFL
jgi:hypothetical protein